MKLHSIIVTGCGGDIGISVGRLLKEEGLAARLIGLDIKKYHPGIAFFDSVYQIVPVTDKNYLSQIADYVSQNKADIILPITEPEIAFFTEHDIQQIGPAKVIIANRESVLTGLDKFKTFEVLSSANIPMPYTWLANKGPTSLPLPCIIKNRYGYGSKNVVLAQTLADLTYHLAHRENAICQIYLPNDDAEYTCGLFRSTNKETRTFTLRRRLLGGLTGEGLVEEIPAINKLLIKIGEALQLNGSINVQLRMTEDGPKPFEINPRFSSTVYFRHLLNFKDVIWSIYDKFNLDLPHYHPSPIGTRIYRTFNELILPPESE